MVNKDIETQVRKARAGQASAWEFLFHRYQKPLYVYCFELARDEQLSLDLVQDTFVQASKHLESLREDGKFGSWLFSLAHQKILGHWRKRKTELLELDEEGACVEDDKPVPSEILVDLEQQSTLLASIQELAEEHRSALLLFYLEDFSLFQIAEITATPLGTVKSRLYYAKKQLQRKLKEQNYEKNHP